MDVELLIDAGQAVFHRSERKLIRAYIARLSDVIAREPDHADDVLRTLALLFGHEAADIQASAVRLVIAHASEVSPQTRTELAAAASQLPADLRAAAAQVLGAVDSPVQSATPPLPALVAPEFPAPIASPADLVEELEILQRELVNTVDGVRLERVLAALVAFAYQDRNALVDAFASFLRARPYITARHYDWSYPSGWRGEYHELRALIGPALAAPQGTATTPYPPAEVVVGESQWWPRAEEDRMPGPQRALVHRLHEISVGLAYAPRPMLLATPTQHGGLLDPDVLLNRLTQAAAAGWEPWEHDLTQALLRLPKEQDMTMVPRGEKLGTHAGRRLARWLTHHGSPEDAGELGQLIAAPVVTQPWYGGGAFLSCWPMVLPTDFDVIAGHLVRYLKEQTLGGGGRGGVLTALVHSSGPMRQGGARALAHGLDAHDKNDRAEAVDALLVLAARGQWDGPVLGRQIGALAADTELSLSRVVPCLRDLAQSGAATHVWDTMAAALPAMLSPDLERPPQRLADLLAFGVELVDHVRPDSVVIPELTAVAARRGSSRIITEAKRLTAALT